MVEFVDLFLLPSTYISLAALTFMEVVLGVDNIIFIAIVTGRVAPEERARARSLGLTLAILFRILLLLGIAHLAHLTKPLFSVFAFEFSGRDLVLLAGGLFLVAKSTIEIHHRLQGDEDELKRAIAVKSFWSAVGEIIILDLVFSFDSVITAVGLVREIPIMVIAVLFSLGVMLAFSGMISNFINRYPTVKILALAFLLMIGMLLFAEGFHIEVPKGYAYFAMAFSLFVELLNIRAHRRRVGEVKGA